MKSRVISNNVFWSLNDLLTGFADALFSGEQEYRFETLCAEVVPTDKIARCFGFSSGRAGLLFALNALYRREPGRNEVVVPTYVCSGVVEPILKAGLTPIFCGIGRDLNIDSVSCLRSLSHRTLAVIVPHTYGFPAPILRLTADIKTLDNKIFVIDDASAGVGNKIDGEYLGSLGDVGVLSLNQAKPFPATGGGIVAICNHSLLDDFVSGHLNLPPFPKMIKLAESSQFILNYKYPLLGAFLKYLGVKLFGKDQVSFKPRYGFRISPLDVELVRKSLKQVVDVHEQRRRIMEMYAALLTGHGNVHVPHPPGDFFLSRFSVVIPGLGKYLLDRPMALEDFKYKGIFFQRGYPPLAASFSGTRRVSASLSMGNDVLVLPVDHRLAAEGHSHVVEAALEIARCV